jgi:GTP cyclohydrolase III
MRATAEQRTQEFSDQLLDQIQIVHDASGPRSALAFYLGRQNYIQNTTDLSTQAVEDFIMSFYSQYNQRHGSRY